MLNRSTLVAWVDQRRAELRLAPALLRHTLPAVLRAGLRLETTLAEVLARNAASAPDALAIEMGDERLTYAELDARVSRIAAILVRTGLQARDVVALIGGNSPMYVALVLGVARAGGCTALINYNLKGELLERAIAAATPRFVIVEQEFAANIAGSRNSDLRVFEYGSGELDVMIAREPRSRFRQVRVTTNDEYVYIYTSGTTGLPKACRVTHSRALLGGSLFGAVTFDFHPSDKLYCVLPLYHSSALLVGVGSCLVAKVPIALRRKFSASEFFSDVRRYNATAMLYIGELCRSLVNLPPSPNDREHALRIAVGNGMNAETWRRFSERFGISRIAEFYAATESPTAIINFTGRVGSVGHIPFRRIRGLRFARFDSQTGDLYRNDQGLCVECAPGEIGELLMRLRPVRQDPLGGFAGYRETSANTKKIVRDVFREGDAYYRSGDLMQIDADGHVRFVDRIGDTFRWKGENVSTTEVESELAKVSKIRAASVVGVQVPGLEGRAGLAAIVWDGEFDARALWNAVQALPNYAQPRFVRLVTAVDMTATFKLNKQSLAAVGIDPERTPGSLFLRSDESYVPLTLELWNDVVCGRVRI